MVVDEIARRQPDLLYASVPQTTNISDGFKGVTFSDIATATDHVANWIDRAFGRSSNFDTIAYMGIGDLRYVVVFLAAVKCGYKVRSEYWMCLNIPAYPLVGLASIVEKLGLDECISYGADRMYFAFTRIRG
jgi:hypothetical protein